MLKENEVATKGSAEKPVTLAPLSLEQALGGLLAVKPPEPADKPKRKKTPPADKG